MKNFLNLIFTAALIVWGCLSCQKISIEGEPSGWADRVTLTLISPDALTKAIGDGTKAKELYYTAFVDGRPVQSLQNKVELVDGKAVLDLDLVKNVTYKFVFWAQSVPAEEQVQPYDLSEFYTSSEVKVNYSGLSNDDNRDAFCAMKEITVKKDKNATIYLRRPFAQVNFCAQDYEMVKHMNLQNEMKSETGIYGLPDKLKVLDGSVSVSGESVPVDAFFDLADIPSGDDEYITVQGNKYGYISMNYVLASEIGETVSVKARMVSGESEWITNLLPNVPVRRNYKTNIVGELFVENAVLQIIIEPDFNTPDFIEQF